MKTEKIMPYDEAKALSVKEKFNIRLGTILDWKKAGQMPRKYFNLSGYQINDLTLIELRGKYKLNQKQFIEQFNQRFKEELSQTLVSLWENGYNVPSKKYSENLALFFSEKEKEPSKKAKKQKTK